jgi:response regulator RpfG family c-di-GMP phosphodiesterase
MRVHEKVNILMVDDQPAKLLSYGAILDELDENLIKANSGNEAPAISEHRHHLHHIRPVR